MPYRRNEPVIFYKATEADAEMLAGLRIRFITEFAGQQPDKEVNNLKEILTGYFRTATHENQCINYYAMSGDQIAGTGGIIFRVQPGNFKNPSGRIGYVMNMFTLPQFRKKGICTTILEKLIEDAKALGITAFELHATEAGHPIYTANGFNLHHEPTMRRYI